MAVSKKFRFDVRVSKYSLDLLDQIIKVLNTHTRPDQIKKRGKWANITRSFVIEHMILRYAQALRIEIPPCKYAMTGRNGSMFRFDSKDYAQSDPYVLCTKDVYGSTIGISRRDCPCTFYTTTRNTPKNVFQTQTE